MAVLESGAQSAHGTRPSFYAAIRLARLIHFVKDRFKSRIRARRLSVEPRAICHRDSFRADVIEEIGRASNLHFRSGTFVRPRRSGKNAYGEELGVSMLLHDLDSHTKARGDSVSKVAVEDQQFLRYDAHQATIAKTTAMLSHIHDTATLLLDRLHHLSGNPTEKHDSLNDSSLFKCEKFVANLEHILRCLQQAVLEALIYNTIEADILHWHQYWQQQRQRREGWFAEWPNGQRPLNTTWPWNVKPSLVILWGVCWKFYDFDGNSDNDGWMTRMPARPDRSDETPLSEHILWTRPQVSFASNTQSSTDQPPHHGAWNIGWNINTFQDASWAQPLEGDRVTAEFYDSHARSQDISRDCNNPESEPLIPLFRLAYPSVTSESFPVQSSSAWPYTLENRSTDPSDPLFNEWEPACNQPEQQPIQRQLHQQTLVPPLQMIEREGAVPFGHRLRQQTTSRPNLEVPTVIMGDYPSPRSIVSAARMSPSRAPLSPGLEAYPPSSSIESPQSRQEADVRTTGQTRNENGQLYCDHPDCASEIPVFFRTCEYKKHKDKHERPYVCEEPGCEKILGFTYSGGLLRHQREVHGQHGGPKASCMCPHRDCKRSTGRGFSRKENLSEHLRRVHRGVGDITETPPIGTTTDVPLSTSQQISGVAQLRKRKRVDCDSDDDDDDDLDDGSSSRDLQLQVKRLRREVRQKDERLKKLELKVERLVRGHPAAPT